MARTSAAYVTPSCLVFLTLSMPPFWLYITFVRRHIQTSLLQLMLCSQRALFPTFLLLLLLPSADLFQLFLTSPVLADNSCGVFTNLFPRVSYSIGFCRHFWVLFLFAGFWFFTRLCSGTHLVLRDASSWVHGWGVFSLSMVLE